MIDIIGKKGPKGCFQMYGFFVSEEIQEEHKKSTIVKLKISFFIEQTVLKKTKRC